MSKPNQPEEKDQSLIGGTKSESTTKSSIVTTTVEKQTINNQTIKYDNETIQLSSDILPQKESKSMNGSESTENTDQYLQIGALEDCYNRLYVGSQSKDQDFLRKIKELDKLKDDTQSFTSRSRYEREKKKIQNEEEVKARTAEIKDFSVKADNSKRELTNLLDNSIKYRETAIDSLQDLNKIVDKDKNQTFVFGDVNRANVGNDYYKQMVDNIASKLNDQSRPDISKLFKQYKEEMKDQLTPQGTFYEGNLSYLKDITTLVYDLIEKDNTILLLRNIVDILNERVIFDAKDLNKRLSALNEDITTIDQGTKNMNSKVEFMKSKIGDLSFSGPLSRIQDKIQRLNSSNNENADAANASRKDLDDYKALLGKKNPAALTQEDIPELRKELTKIEGGIESEEDVRRHHLDKYQRLLRELGGLKIEIEGNYERQIKTIQKKDDELVSKTDTNLGEAKAILAELKSKIQGDNPLIKRFIDELTGAEKLLNDTDNCNDHNKADMRDLSNRNMRDDDYFSFIISLSQDQQVIDGHAEETKKNSDDVLKALRNLMEDFDESEKSLKDQILSDCRKMLNAKMNSLPDLEEKLRKLENGVDLSVKTSVNALQVLDKNHPDWNEISKLNKDMTQLERDTKNLRLDKDNLTTNIQRIIQILDSSDPKVIPMNKVLEIQESTNKVCEDHDKTSKGIDEGLDKLRDFDSKLQKLLNGIRDDLKRKTDRLTDDIKDRLNGVNRFLKPTGPISDSIQRPQKLNGLLSESPLHKEDADFNQYQGYCNLVNDNLTRCKYATNDLDRLEGDVKPLIDEYTINQSKDLPIIEQINALQNSFNKIKGNEKHSSDLVDIVKEILSQVDSKKEQEIMDFLSKIKQNRFNDAKDGLQKLGAALGNLDKRWKEVNDENEHFIGVLNSASNTKNNDKLKLIEQLLKESDGSKKDLGKIKQEADEIKKFLNAHDISKLKLDDLHPLLQSIEKYSTLIPKRLEDLNVIDGEIEERKKRWHDFLTHTEAKDKLAKELLSLIPLLREKYERLAKTTNFCSNSLNGFILVNESIENAHFYETNLKPCQNRDQLKAEVGVFSTKVDKYGPQVERFEGYDAQKLKEAEIDEVEELINEATGLIKDLDADNHGIEEISSGLKEERKSLKNGDTYDNHKRIGALIQSASDRLEPLKSEFESIKEALESTEITNPNISRKFNEVEFNIASLIEQLDEQKKDFEGVTHDINREDMNNAKLATIAGVIEKLGKIAGDMDEFFKKLKETEDLFKELQAELIDLCYAKKLRDLNSNIKILLERLARLSDLIDKLIQLSRELNGYTSDAEEDDFVKDLEAELLEVKTKQMEAEEVLKNTEIDIAELLEQLKSTPSKVDEEKAEKIANTIGEIGSVVESIEKLVDSKIQRFADMDPYKKFRRREKELGKLTQILTEREQILEELKKDCNADLNNENSSDELKQICTEVLEEVDPLEENLDNLKQRMSLLRNEIDSYLEKSAKTELTIEEIFELLYANVEIKKKLKLLLAGIDEFSKNLGELRKKYLKKKSEVPVIKNYKAIKGDAVDEMLGNWINTHGCEIEIKRLGGGFYMFGEKKIFAKIINGKLIIRVGGGYMNIDEFMQHYGMMELARQQRAFEMEYESLNYDEIMASEDNTTLTSGSNAVIGIAEAKKNLKGSFGGTMTNKDGRGSPKRGSPRAGKTDNRPGSPGTMVGKQRPGSPRTDQNRPGSPGTARGSTFVKGLPSAAKLEESLRKMEQDAKEGKLKEGYSKMTLKK